MTQASTLALSIRQVYTGGNWTSVDLQHTLAEIDFGLAIEEREGLNSIARLVLHIDYYVDVILRGIRDGVLTGKDEDSWALGLPQNPREWEKLKGEVLAKAHSLADHIETLDEETLNGAFADGKYGTVMRQITGFIEHTHYHLGQIAVLKKIYIA